MRERSLLSSIYSGRRQSERGGEERGGQGVKGDGKRMGKRRERGGEGGNEESKEGMRGEGGNEEGKEGKRRERGGKGGNGLVIRPSYCRGLAIIGDFTVGILARGGDGRRRNKWT